MYGSKVVSLNEVKDTSRSYALIDFDYVFRYGMLGYGYSQQLHQKYLSVKKVVKESLLLRGKVDLTNLEVCMYR